MHTQRLRLPKRPVGTTYKAYLHTMDGTRAVIEVGQEGGVRTPRVIDHTPVVEHTAVVGTNKSVTWDDQVSNNKQSKLDAEGVVKKAQVFLTYLSTTISMAAYGASIVLAVVPT